MSTSPVPIRTPTKRTKTGEGMSFPDALRHVIEGKRITKEEWNDPRIYLELKGEYFMIHKANGSEHTITLRDGDLLGLDWQVLEDQ